MWLGFGLSLIQPMLCGRYSTGLFISLRNCVLGCDWLLVVGPGNREHEYLPLHSSVFVVEQHDYGCVVTAGDCGDAGLVMPRVLHEYPKFLACCFLCTSIADCCIDARRMRDSFFG